MYKISDLVKRDQQAEFRNDVQLSSYEDAARNHSLVNSYLFTTSAPQGYVASTTVLYTLIESYLSDRLDNRFVLIANYGHGKSHLALALANYFGKPYESPEVQTVLSKISSILANAPSALRYKEFKENRGEFLVVRVRGDVPGSLREQFLGNLEKALKEHKLPGDQHLPGWYMKAEKYLVGLQGEDLKKANAYLEKYQTDVPLLIQEVELKRDKAYDLFIHLFAHLDEHGFQPNMEGELSLDQAIRWAANEFCGEGKPLGGIVILFDEFNLYITNYAQRSAAGDLQDMLNGVSNCQGKVAFLAFAQQDPVTIAQNVLATGATQRDSLLKELNRIPRQFVLYSLMESVIDSYLQQPVDTWQLFKQDPLVSLPLAQATNIALDQFKERYEKLGWRGVQKFEDVVTKGCFPLHPITTALLCSVQFQQSVTTAGTPRNMLGFILEQLERLADQPAIVGKRLNWVLPTYLVDYFGERLPAEHYHAYQQAVQRIPPDDDKCEFCAAEQTDILKALLLQQIAKLKARDDDQIELIASMVGMSVSDTKRCLRLLADTRVIAWNQDGRRAYGLWSATFDPYKLDQILGRKLTSVPLVWQDLVSFSKEQLQAMPVAVAWGHPNDWQASEYVVDSENFRSSVLKDLIGRFALDTHTGLREGERGCVIWLTARSEDEVSQLRQTAQKTIDDAFAEQDPLPVIVFLPTHVNYGLLDFLHRKKALGLFTSTDQEEVGIEIYRAQVAQEAVNVTNALRTLRGGDNYRDLLRSPVQIVVPTAYRNRVQQLGQTNLAKLLEECYQVAYRFSPPEFFQQYAVSSRNFRGAVRLVSIDLLHRDSGSLNGTTRSNAIAHDMVTLLRQKWQILTSDNRIKEPEQSRIATAWVLLNQTFPTNGQETSVKQTLATLFNPPYGYDYNTATLLFCIWLGYNTHDTEVRTAKGLLNLKNLDEWIQEGPKDFINALCVENATVARRDAAQTAKAVKDILARVKAGNFTKPEALDAITKLGDFSNNDKNDSVLIQEAHHAVEEISAGLRLIEVYEAQIAKTLGMMGRERNIKTLYGHLQALGNVTEGTLVMSDVPTVSQVRSQLMEWLEKVVEKQCAELEKLPDITYLQYNLSQLDELRADLAKVGLPHLIERVDQATLTLKVNSDGLRASVQESMLQSSIKAMNPHAGLSALYDYQTQLRGILHAADETLRLRDLQLALVDHEIEQLETFAAKAQGELDGVAGRGEFDTFRERLQSVSWRYEGTKHQSTLQAVRDRAEQLHGFYDEITQLASQHLNTADEARAVKNQINSVGRKYLNLVGVQQYAFAREAQASIDEYVQKQEQQALRWLEEQIAKYESAANLPQLRSRLENPPGFFPEKDRGRLSELTRAIDQRLDESVIEQVEFYFLQIKDHDLRIQCVARLQERMDEKAE